MFFRIPLMYTTLSCTSLSAHQTIVSLVSLLRHNQFCVNSNRHINRFWRVKRVKKEHLQRKQKWRECMKNRRFAWFLQPQLCCTSAHWFLDVRNAMWAVCNTFNSTWWLKLSQNYDATRAISSNATYRNTCWYVLFLYNFEKIGLVLVPFMIDW